VKFWFSRTEDIRERIQSSSNNQRGKEEKGKGKEMRSKMNPSHHVVQMFPKDQKKSTASATVLGEGKKEEKALQWK